MVITIEPGLYIASDAPDVPEALRGIGVRIEDDLVITSGAPEVLTAACPKQISELEALTSSR
jgi:Xaa-Pro aminopeptidase